ncbi:MAG TPA: hypothetical protein VLM90_08510, partial [Candidatus Deferrimicrobium sp.]|nr:hypothetical protein [Candidatus Deferrimicrobium sp.]
RFRIRDTNVFLRRKLLGEIFFFHAAPPLQRIADLLRKTLSTPHQIPPQSPFPKGDSVIASY